MQLGTSTGTVGSGRKEIETNGMQIYCNWEHQEIKRNGIVRRVDFTLEEMTFIYLASMTCPFDLHMDAKKDEKILKYTDT